MVHALMCIQLSHPAERPTCRLHQRLHPRSTGLAGSGEVQDPSLHIRSNVVGHRPHHLVVFDGVGIGGDYAMGLVLTRLWIEVHDEIPTPLTPSSTLSRPHTSCRCSRRINA